MPKEQWSSITVKKEFCEKLMQYSKHKKKSLPKLIIESFEEQEKLRNLAKKITKTPESVRIYI
jgi:hypothetical protein